MFSILRTHRHAYYNEIDLEKCAWLRELMQRGVIADGEIDERSITKVEPHDLRQFAQCHFFAGIGCWSYALRLAGWPDDRPVWTGSCPCPSFSAAGKGGGFNDPRHLWPDWARLVRECKPATLFGEQADDAIGYGWLDLVQTDLERENYAVGKAVLGACSVGAPHIRQRLYFVAHAEAAEAVARSGEVCQGTGTNYANGFGIRSDSGRMEHSSLERLGEARRSGSGSGLSGERASGGMEYPEHRTGTTWGPRAQFESRPPISERFASPVVPLSMGDTSDERLPEREHERGISQRAFFSPTRQSAESGSHVNGFWKNADWILRKRWNSDDWEWCPTEPGTFPLVAGAAARVLRLRGYGDAIVPQVAQAFIEAYVDSLQSPTSNLQSQVSA